MNWGRSGRADSPFRFDPEGEWRFARCGGELTIQDQGSICNNDADGGDEKDAANVMKFECEVCGYVYDPEQGDEIGGVEHGTPFEDLLASWVCPWCGASRDNFKPYAG